MFPPPMAATGRGHWRISAWPRRGTTYNDADPRGRIGDIGANDEQSDDGGRGCATTRKRLGHKHIQARLRYAEQSDAVADTETCQRRRTTQHP